VLGCSGGALQQMVRPFRWFVGGPLGKGLQWISWIYIEELVAAFHLLNCPDFSGHVKLTAPNPVQNRDFSRAIGKILGRSSWMPATGFTVRLVLGEFGSVMLKGQGVLPQRLMETGFRFQYPEIEEALRDLIG